MNDEELRQCSYRSHLGDRMVPLKDFYSKLNSRTGHYEYTRWCTTCTKIAAILSYRRRNGRPISLEDARQILLEGARLERKPRQRIVREPVVGICAICGIDFATSHSQSVRVSHGLPVSCNEHRAILSKQQRIANIKALPDPEVICVQCKERIETPTKHQVTRARMGEVTLHKRCVPAYHSITMAGPRKRKSTQLAESGQTPILCCICGVPGNLEPHVYAELADAGTLGRWQCATCSAPRVPVKEGGPSPLAQAYFSAREARLPIRFHYGIIGGKGI